MQPEPYNTIEGWLEAIDVGVLSATAPAGDAIPQVNHSNPLLFTPRRQPNPNQIIEEVSPTDTSFSATTIFDTLVHKPLRYNHGPPSNCDSLDTYSDITTVYNEEDKESVAEERGASDWAIIVEEVITPDEAISLDTDTGEASFSPSDTTTSSKICEQEERVRIVSLTSCLQCIHLHLPCSRTYPCCTRCARNSRADLCLLHRRRFASEFGRGGGPVLLKVEGEDEELRKRKLELKQAMAEEWAVELEKKNWVLPSVLGEKGGWQKRGVWMDEGEGYLGEGEGRVVLRELVVELEG